MSFVMEKLLTPSPRPPQRPSDDSPQPRLNISVVFTSVDLTLAALKEAGKLAHRLHAKITLIVPQVVPYGLPLASPPVLLDWNERRFRVIAEQSPVETSVQMYLCRDATETLLHVLKPHSLVVLGGHKRIWPTAESRLASRLRKAGHEVILTDRDEPAKASAVARETEEYRDSFMRE